jgi:transposase-like protein
VAEVARLERALAALQGIEGGAATQRPAPPTRRRRRGRPPGRRDSGSRADQFLAHVRDNPGATVSEAAKRMGIGPNYLYRIAATLEREGTVRREGRSFVAPGTSGPAAPEQPGDGAPTGVAIEPADLDS